MVGIFNGTPDPIINSVMSKMVGPDEQGKDGPRKNKVNQPTRLTNQVKPAN